MYKLKAGQFFELKLLHILLVLCILLYVHLRVTLNKYD